MNIEDLSTMLPFVGDVFGTSAPKTSLTFHWNGGLAGLDPFPQLVADANLHVGNGWGGISYHKAIGMDGTVYLLRNPLAILAAVANADGNANSEMVQLMIGRTDDGSTIQHPSPEMWASAAELAREAQAQDKPIYGHRDWSSTECPGEEIYAWIQRQGWQEEDMATPQELWDNGLAAIVQEKVVAPQADTNAALKQALAALSQNASGGMSDAELAILLTKLGVVLERAGADIATPKP